MSIERALVICVLVILVGVVAAKRRQTKKLPDPGKLVDFLEPRMSY